MVRALLVTLIAAALAGCPLDAGGGACAPGDDCGDGAVCTDLGACAAADSAPPWRITWSVNGARVSIDQPGECDAVDELSLEISALDEVVLYRPVTCAIGQFDFTALPSRFDRVVLEAFAGGDRIDSERGARDGGELALELVF